VSKSAAAVTILARFNVGKCLSSASRICVTARHSFLMAIGFVFPLAAD
jgi:hypothetical protein